MDKWVSQWKVKGSTGNVYTVSMDKNGKFACSCPAWTRNMPRKDCKHIKEIRDMIPYSEIKTSSKKAKYILAMVNKPIYKAKTNELYIPLIRLPDDILMEATIVYSMYKHGWSWDEIKMHRRLPKSWTLGAVINHIKTHGLASYPRAKA